MYLGGDQWYDSLIGNGPDRFERRCRKFRCWCAVAILACLVGIATIGWA